MIPVLNRDDICALTLFTRYPEPGKAKTRMIPLLGADKAAQLQECMTGYTVLRARVWQACRDARVIVNHTGAAGSTFRQWLGPGLYYRPQGKGSLGDRMSHAVDDALRQGFRKIVLMGCDCPGVTPMHIKSAFDALDECDVVIGPASDGGYYLIGMKNNYKSFFTDIDWGTGRVYDQTMRRIREGGLRCHELETLPDVDEAGDIHVWERILQPARSFDSEHSLSVIIPAINESERISDCVKSAFPGAFEVIVADGGSSDDTCKTARDSGAKVISTPRGRAIQMNAAALKARGEYLLFLHADSRLPENFDGHVHQTLSKPHVEAGAFSLAINADGSRYRAVEWGVHQRCRYCSMPYGDQALFMRRETFWRMGGYARMPLMEDHDMVRRIKKRGRIEVVDAAVLTSARRWNRLGVARTVWLNQIILLGARLGISHERLAEWYGKY